MAKLTKLETIELLIELRIASEKAVSIWNAIEKQLEAKKHQEYELK